MLVCTVNDVSPAWARISASSPGDTPSTVVVGGPGVVEKNRLCRPGRAENNSTIVMANGVSRIRLSKTDSSRTGLSSLACAATGKSPEGRMPGGWYYTGGRLARSQGL